MRRLDFIGVPGIGKTSTCKVLKKIRRSTDRYWFFDEAYNMIVSSKLSPHVKFGHKILKNISNSPLSGKPVKKFETYLDGMLHRERTRLEMEHFADSIFKVADRYPVFMQLILNGIGKQCLSPSHFDPADYTTSLKKIMTRVNQYTILEQSIDDESLIIFDSSFSHKVFSVVDFSQRLDPEMISRYFESMPRPSAIVLCNLPAEDIVTRIRKRASESHANPWHKPILDQDLLNTWVEFACQVASQARKKILEMGIPLMEIDTAKKPPDIAKQIREFIVSLS